MAKNDDKFVMTGIVVDAAKGGLFKVRIENEAGNSFDVMAKLSGKLQMNKIRVLRGDTVDIEVSSMDPTKGRIVWRNKMMVMSPWSSAPLTSICKKVSVGSGREAVKSRPSGMVETPRR